MKKTLSPGAALVKLRWDKSTPEERIAHARMMVNAREKKRIDKAKKRPHNALSTGRLDNLRK